MIVKFDSLKPLFPNRQFRQFCINPQVLQKASTTPPPIQDTPSDSTDHLRHQSLKLSKYSAKNFTVTYSSESSSSSIIEINLMVSEPSFLGFSESMADGTRSKTAMADEKLTYYDQKMKEYAQGLTQTKDGMNLRFGAVDSRLQKVEHSLEEITLLLVNLQPSNQATTSGVTKVDGSNQGDSSTIGPTPHPVSSTTTSSGNTPPSFPFATHTLVPPNTVFASPTPQIQFNGIFPPTAQPFTIPSSASFSHSPPYFTTTTTLPPHMPSTNLQQLNIPPPTGFTYPNLIPPYSQPNHNTPVTPTPHNRSDFSNFNPVPKLEFPKFDGQDPKGWVLRADQYFEFINIDENKKMKLAGIHFEGRASIWFRFYQASRRCVSWRLFVNDVITRFENYENGDVQDRFNKLLQTGTVADYEDQFEELRALVVSKNKGLPEEYFVSSFMSGLKEHIKGAVKMFRPQTFGDVVFLAKQEESRGTKFSTDDTVKPVFKYTTNSNVSSVTGTPNAFKLTASKNPKRTKSTLSSAEIVERRAQGLCFHCDDAYHPGQECKARLYSIIGEEECDDEDPFTPVGLQNKTATTQHKEEAMLAEISLHALTGSKAINTIRLQGKIKDHLVHILLDSGSTHSFIDTQLVKQLKLSVETIPPLAVTVADGSNKIVDTACKGLQYTIQGCSFSSDLRMYPLGGYDIILGVDWLQQHNPITFDYQTMHITVHKGGTQVKLKGTEGIARLQTLTGKQLPNKRENKVFPLGSICMLHTQEPDATKSLPITLPAEVHTLLPKYDAAFTAPTGLSPPRQHDHHLPLAEWGYNTSYTSALPCSPYEALYGAKPRQKRVPASHRSPVCTVEEFQMKREAMDHLLKEPIPAAQRKYPDFNP